MDYAAGSRREVGDVGQRVQALCANGQAEGVIRLKRGWLTPKSTQKPIDGRKRNGRKANEYRQENENGKKEE